VKLPNINSKRGISQGSGIKRSGSFASMNQNARSAFVAKKERKE